MKYMGNRIIILLFCFSSMFCNDLSRPQSAEDDSNDPIALLSRFLIRNSISSLSGTSNIDSNLPSNLSVSVPRSIRKTSSDSSLSERAIESYSPFEKSFLARLEGNPQEFIKNGTSGLGVLQGGTTIISKILQESTRDLILLSPVLEVAKTRAGTCVPGGENYVTIPESAITDFELGMKRLGLPDAEAKAEVARLQKNGVLPIAGQAIPTPALIYRTSNDPLYPNQISYTFSETITQPQLCPSNPTEPNAFTKTLRYNDDQTEILTRVQKTLSFFNFNVAVEASIAYSTGATRKDRTILNTKMSSKIGRETVESSQRLIIEECKQISSENSKNCVSLNFTQTEKNEQGKIETTTRGRTDDDGGFISTEVSIPVKTQKLKVQLEETYDSSGGIDWLRFRVSIPPGSPGGGGPGGRGGGWSPWSSIGAKGQLAETYAFEEEDLFSGSVFLLLIASTETNAIATGAYSSDDTFVLVLGSANPNDDEKVIIGGGTFVDFDGNSSQLVQTQDNPRTPEIDEGESNEVEIFYFGTANDVPNVKVWRSKFDDSGSLVYELTPSKVRIR